MGWMRQIRVCKKSLIIKFAGEGKQMGNETGNMKHAGRGRLIALEGIDGSGKSTQAAYLCGQLKREGICCCHTMEPTDSPIGALIRQILRGEMKTDNRVIAGLFVATVWIIY